ncbi:MAG: ADP-ribosylglycohydrolase family protein [Armatimonadetes bacterium]|nr:ADP-ribosylglycohydrolase family protein [Armatimonadota bacterium]
MAVINRGELWRRVYACAMGKNAGGTLGAPVEGQPGPHNFDWYPKLQEGGIPNDDLEMQLVWFDAVKRAGWKINSLVLSQAWLTHIGYNWNEYGIAKRNLRWGLQPPLSGAYDNDFFKDCMGSPIRSEIWACLAPASPRIAVRFAFEDAIVDHAGGEGVWGEMFFAALESAAFAMGGYERLDELLDIALAYIPYDCQIHRAVTDTRSWWAELKDWKKVRERIAEKYWHREPTHAPQNIAFTVLGLLASDGDFGRAICTAVNCGQDTDCTGATSGAVMGILLGELPKRWIEPLGEMIATTISWGGLRNFTPPQNVRVLTDQIVEAAAMLLPFYGAPIRISDEPTELKSLPQDWLMPDDGIYELWERNKYPWQCNFELSALNVSVDYRGAPTINPQVQKPLTVWLQNRQPMPMRVQLQWHADSNYCVEPYRQDVVLEPNGIVGVDVSVSAPMSLRQTQTLWLILNILERPNEVAIPVTLIGERKWQIKCPDNGWRVEWVKDSQLPLEEWFGGKPGMIEARIWLHSPNRKQAVIGFPCNARFELSLNGITLLSTHQPDYLVRPGQQGPQSHYARTTLRIGWNELKVKVARGDEPVSAYLILTDPTDLHRHITDVVLTMSPEQ